MGRERLNKKPLKPIGEINMTPLIDLTFLLLIAFIIAFPMIEQGVKIQLPKGDAEKLDQKKSQTITVKYMGGTFLNDREVTREALEAAVTQPEPGEAYGVGQDAPYEIYIWDAVNGTWRNNGCIQGAEGSAGAPGATFRPNVDAAGNIFWTNAAGLENPAPQNIRGPAGQNGAAGPAGASAFEAAVEAGYQGTQATFNAALAALPYHGARHLPGGADPISVRTESLEDGAVTAEKLAAGAVSVTYLAELDPARWEGTSIPYTQTVSLAGLRSSDTPLVDVALSGTFSTDRKRLEDYAQIYRAQAGDGSLTVYAVGRPTASLPLHIMCIRK